MEFENSKSILWLCNYFMIVYNLISRKLMNFKYIFKKICIKYVNWIMENRFSYNLWDIRDTWDNLLFKVTWLLIVSFKIYFLLLSLQV